MLDALQLHQPARYTPYTVYIETNIKGSVSIAANNGICLNSNIDTVMHSIYLSKLAKTGLLIVIRIYILCIVL
jgi:hypothetical protein